MYDNRIRGLFDALKISTSGLAAQRRKLNAIAKNLANIHTTNTPEGGPYRRKITRLVEMNGRTTFANKLARERLMLATPRIGHMDPEKGLKGWRFAGVQASQVRDDSEPITVYDPTHPDADEFGYVEMPNINVVTEMVDMIGAQRAYEANVTAIKTTKDMAQKALEI